MITPQAIVQFLKQGWHCQKILSEFPQECRLIEHLTNFLPKYSPLRRRLWHIQHNTFDIPTCSVCNATVQWKNPTSTYNTFCSKKCAQSTRKNIPRSPETVGKIKQTKKNNPKRAWNKGISQTIEHKITQSETRKRKLATGEIVHWNKGGHHTSETKRKISETALRQQRTYSEYSKQKRLETYAAKKEDGWVHPSSKAFRDCLVDSSKFDDKEWLYQQHIVNQRTLASICVELGLHWKNSQKTVKRQLQKFGIPVKHWHQASSKQQKDVEYFLETLGIDFETRNRTLIKPYELDIFVPSKKTAIEYCGLLWHSHAYKPNNYHYLKLEACNNQGIRLITIFEDEWLNKRGVVKRKLSDVFGVSNEPAVYGRNTNVVLVDSLSKQQFFDRYHIQGNGPSSLNYGLIHNNELVACMGFIQKQTKYVLSRFCTSCKVLGGFSKLLNYFKRSNMWDQIVTFADLRWSVGNLYANHGFTLEKVLPPDYKYIIRNERVHKFNFRRKYLSRRLSTFTPFLSEVQNTENNGILRIYDCGKNRYIVNNT